MDILYGALGAFVVLLAAALGGGIGWKLRDILGRHRAAQTENDEERHRVMEEQRAFEHMLHYNMDTAYGLNDGIDGLMGGDGL